MWRKGGGGWGHMARCGSNLTSMCICCSMAVWRWLSRLTGASCILYPAKRLSLLTHSSVGTCRDCYPIHYMTVASEPNQKNAKLSCHMQFFFSLYSIKSITILCLFQREDYISIIFASIYLIWKPGSNDSVFITLAFLCIFFLWILSAERDKMQFRADLDANNEIRIYNIRKSMNFWHQTIICAGIYLAC